MKRGAHDHPKMLRLARELGVKRGIAVMTIELLLHWMERYAPRGDIGRFDDSDIAAAAEWEGDPGVLVSALRVARWLDVSAEHRLVFHDWPEHCDRYVHIKLFRKKLLFADGSMPSGAGVSKTERERDGLDVFWDAMKRGRTTPEPVQEPLIPDQSVCAHNVHSCAPPPPPPPPPPREERESDSRARGFGRTSEPSPPPEELGEGERAAIRIWAKTYAIGALDRLLVHEQACLAHARRKGRTSSDWVSDVKLWILDQGAPRRGEAPARGSPSTETYGEKLERSQQIDRSIGDRRDAIEDARQERASPETVAECMGRFRLRKTA